MRKFMRPRQIIRFGVALLGWCATAALIPAASHAQDATPDFYSGRTLRVVVGFPPGGGFDLYARLLAEYLPKYLPGHPNIVVENMPGATTARAAAYIYSVAPQDGTVLGIVHQQLLANQVLGVQAGDFDVVKFNWIGRAGMQLDAGVAWYTSGVTSIADAKTKSIAFGATTATAASAMITQALNALTGTKFKVVVGYQGSADFNLAMERGEIQGYATGLWTDFMANHPEWLADHKVVPLFQTAMKRNSLLPDVPVLPELTQDPDDRQIFDLLASTEEMGRAFIAGPGVPKERVRLLRKAFSQMMTDPQLLADAKAQQLEINAMAGNELQAYVTKVGEFPAALTARAKSILLP
jgi:tripartite-type tricarboxylate transporter receptor subunit TctC